MEASIVRDRFVNVVARVDTASGEGKLLYVNPSRTSVVSNVQGASGFELLVEDVDGEELLRVPAQVRVSSCSTDGDTGALIQQDIPFVEGARRIRLLRDGEELDRYETAQPSAAAGATLLATAGPQPHKTLVEAEQIEPEDGVTYTIEARPEGAAAWQAIAVGRARPVFELDRNQFPGAAAIDVRVVRSTGFEEQVIAQQRFQDGV